MVDLSTAHTAAAVQAGFVWINEVSKHFLGAQFGGYKQSGIGREKCFEEMLAYTQDKEYSRPAGQTLSSIPSAILSRAFAESSRILYDRNVKGRQGEAYNGTVKFH